MKLSEDIRPITYMKTHSADLMKQVGITRRPLIITQNGVAKAVVLDIETHEKQMETLKMLKIIARGEEAIKNGELIDHDDVFGDVEELLK